MTTELNSSTRSEIQTLRQKMLDQETTIQQQRLELERSRKLYDSAMAILHENEAAREKAAAAVRRHRLAMDIQQAIIRHLLFTITQLVGLMTS